MVENLLNIALHFVNFTNLYKSRTCNKNDAFTDSRELLHIHDKVNSEEYVCKMKENDFNKPGARVTHERTTRYLRPIAILNQQIPRTNDSSHTSAAIRFSFFTYPAKNIRSGTINEAHTADAAAGDHHSAHDNIFGQ